MSTWPQRVLRYDGTYAGFLTCVGESFRQRIYPFYFLPPRGEQTGLYPLQAVPTDPALAQRVYRALAGSASPAFRRLVTYGFLTDLPLRERNLFDLIYLAFHQALPQDPADGRFLVLTRAIRRLVDEAEHWQGRVRLADYGGVLVGQLAPQARVLPLLRLHFCRRLPEGAFLLHDQTHREGLFWAGGKWKVRPVDRLDLDRPARAEAQCRQLWRRFLQSVAAEGRPTPPSGKPTSPCAFGGKWRIFMPPALLGGGFPGISCQKLPKMPILRLDQAGVS